MTQNRVQFSLKVSCQKQLGTIVVRLSSDAIVRWDYRPNPSFLLWPALGRRDFDWSNKFAVVEQLTRLFTLKCVYVSVWRTSQPALRAVCITVWLPAKNFVVTAYVKIWPRPSQTLHSVYSVTFNSYKSMHLISHSAVASYCISINRCRREFQINTEDISVCW